MSKREQAVVLLIRLCSQHKRTPSAVEASELLEQIVNRHEFRTWTDDTGKHATEAKYVSMAGGIVSIERRDGTAIRVPMERLSLRDIDYVLAVVRAEEQARQ